MSRRIEFHEQAAVDYDAAFDWYQERSPRAAHRFDVEVDRALTQIAVSPDRWPGGSHDTRRYLLRGFPFLLIYREMTDGAIQVLAVAHTSRRPEFWKARV